MNTLLTPKNDYVFKRLFAGDTEILINLINSVLDLPEYRRIRSVEVKNPNVLPEDISKKFIVLDIRAIDESENEYDIEMQVRKYESYPKRTLYYLCKMYADQLKSGEDYIELSPVIGIHFLDYEQFPEHPEFHYRFILRDMRYPEISLTDDLSLHIFELPGIHRHMLKHPGSQIVEWIYFFNHAHEEGDKSMREHYVNPMIHKAFNVLEKLSDDDLARQIAETREKALKDEAAFLNEARRQGEKEGFVKGEKEGFVKGMNRNARETARILLSMGDLSEEKIAKATGLSLEEVKSLRRSDG
jgi:predicted transposase/invertase (TIGR01784 family)